MAFLVFEGLDGSGKSTLIRELGSKLAQSDQRFVVTREPGGTALGEELRQILLAPRETPPHPSTELLLYEAGRAQHVAEVIRPALSQGLWVLCDRFTASSLAFQCGGRGLPEAEVEGLNHFATGGLKADLTVLLDLPVEQSVERIRRRQNLDRFEKEASEFHERVRQFYLALARKQQNWLTLDSTKPVKELLATLTVELKQRQWL